MWYVLGTPSRKRNGRREVPYAPVRCASIVEVVKRLALLVVLVGATTLLLQSPGSVRNADRPAERQPARLAARDAPALSDAAGQPSMVRVTLTSDPPGASVWIEDTYRGETPLVVSVLPGRATTYTVGFPSSSSSAARFRAYEGVLNREADSAISVWLDRVSSVEASTLPSDSQVQSPHITVPPRTPAVGLPSSRTRYRDVSGYGPDGSVYGSVRVDDRGSFSGWIYLESGDEVYVSGRLDGRSTTSVTGDDGERYDLQLEGYGQDSLFGRTDVAPVGLPATIVVDARPVNQLGSGTSFNAPFAPQAGLYGGSVRVDASGRVSGSLFTDEGLVFLSGRMTNGGVASVYDSSGRPIRLEWGPRGSVEPSIGIVPEPSRPYLSTGSSFGSTGSTFSTPSSSFGSTGSTFSTPSSSPSRMPLVPRPSFPSPWD